MTTRLVLFTLALLGLCQTKSFSQIYNYGNASTGVPASVAANVVGSNLTLGAGVSQSIACGPTQGFGTEGWPVTNVFDAGVFEGNGDYVEFMVDPDPGFGLKITGFSAQSRRENLSPGTAPDGPIAMRYGYSINNGPWVTINPGNPQSSNLCVSGGVLRTWNPAAFPINTNFPVRFRIYGLSSGSDGTGDMFLRNVVVSGEVCDESPDITFTDNSQQVCRGVTSAPLAYTGTNGSTYSIDYDAAANTAGFTDVGIPIPHINLPTTPGGTISLTVPALAASGTYNGVLTIYNDCGFSSSHLFTVEVWALPTAVLSGDQTICDDDFAALTVSLTGAGPWNLTLSDGTSYGSLAGNTLGGLSPSITTNYTITSLSDANGCVAVPAGLTGSATVTVNPLPAATITASDLDICEGDEVVFTFNESNYPPLTEFTVTAMVTDDLGGPSPIVVTQVVNGGVLILTEGIEFTGDLSITDIIVTHDVNGCDEIFDSFFDIFITVDPLPDVSALNKTICSNTATGLEVTNPNLAGGTFNWTADYNGVIGGDLDGVIGDAYGPNAIDETLVNATDDPIIVTYTLTPIGPMPTFCEGIPIEVLVTVEPAPQFAFSASSTSDLAGDSDNNYDGPGSISVDFCDGDFLTLGGYSDNGAIGYTGFYTTSGNVTGLPVGPVNFTISEGIAGGFFNAVYGPYTLSSGTYGSITQVFTPYLDVNTNGSYDVGIDCPGDPITLNYEIHAVPTVIATPSATTVCDGDLVNIVFSGNYGPGDVTYAWTGGNTAIGMVTASGDGDISFTAINGTNAPIVLNLSVTPSTDNCDGTSVNFTITVYPKPLVSFSASVNGGPAQPVSNASGPASITLDFCAGQSFALSSYAGTPNMGFIEEITGGTTNLLYGVSPIPVPRPQTNISPASAAGFFGGTYGTYNLASGTFGTFTEVFTPYFDSNNDGDYDALTDCLGEPITLIYRVYGPIVVDVVRGAGEICSGSPVDYSITTTSSEDVTFTLTFAENTNGGNPADLEDDNTFPVPTSITINSLSSPVLINQAINNAVGSFDRGRVTLSISDVAYANTSVLCGVTVNNPTPNTQIYPKPFLTDPADVQILSGGTVNLNFDPLAGLPALNTGTAGFPIRVQWTTAATAGATVVGPNSGTSLIYDAAGVLTLGNDIVKTINLSPETCNGMVTFTITPESDGPNPGGGFDGNFCSGDAFDVVVNVVKPITLTSTTTASTVGCGEEFTVSVAVSNFCDIGTLDYNFEWDETLFQFVTHTAPSISGGFVSVNTASAGLGELYYSFYDDGLLPYGSDLAPNTVILTYTLRAIGNAGTYPVPSSIILEAASNGNLSALPVTSTGVDIEIEALSLSLLGNPDVCPSDNNAYLEFDPMAVQGNPNYYIIDFDGCPGFPDTQEGPLVLIDGQIVIPLPPLFVSGSCSGTLVVSNTTYGCESGVINFFILNDDDDPEVPTPAPVTQQCFPAPAPNTNVVIGETDLCTDLENLVVEYEEDLSFDNGGAGCSGDPLVISRVYSVTDEAGNTTYVTQTITIEDNIDPYLLTLPVLSAPWYPTEAAAIVAATAHANLNKRDNCTPQVGITVTLVPSTMMNPNPSYLGCTATIHLVLTDACGNITLVDYTTVVDDENPTIDLLLLAPIDDCYSEADNPVAPYFSYRDAVEAAIAAVTAVANDNCTDPEDLVITATTSGTDCELAITVTVADACGRDTTYTYNTRVESDGPFIPANPLALEGECFNTVEEAEDAAIALAMVGAGDDCTSPNDLQYDVMTNPGCPADIMVVVTDYCGNPSTITFTGVHIDTEDPEALGTPSEYCFQTLTGPLGAYAVLAADAAPTDNCTSTPELIASALDPLGDNPPTFLPFINEGCLQGTIILTFTDNCGNLTQANFEGVTIDDEDPTAADLPNLVFDCLDEAQADEPNILVVEAEDNCGVQDIVHISTILPTSCPGTGTRTYRVTDCSGNYYDVVQTIDVSDDIDPTFTNLFADDLDRSIPCGDAIALQAANDLEPSIEDNCGEPYVIKTAGLFVPGECPQSGTYTNTWRAYDDCGNSSSAVFTQVITVYDNEAPEVNFGCMFAPFLAFTSDGADCPTEAGTSLEVGDVLHPTDTWMVAGIVIPSLQGCVSDNCASESEINIEVISIDVDNIDCSRTISITFEFSDACGNTNPMPFVCEYLIIDDVDPIWETPEGAPFPTGIDVTIDCDDVAELAFANSLAPEASDDCSAVELFKTTSLFVPGVDCPQEGTFTNTWTAEDDCGNTSLVFTQTITVIDNAGPIWITLPFALNTSVSCSNPGALAAAQLLAPVADDNCDGTLSPVKNAGALVPGSCPGTGTITNTWTVTDDCGNISTMYTQLISIIDNTPPTATSASIATCFATVADAQAAAIAATTGMDNCSSVTKTAATIGTCTAVVTVTVTDCAGNTTTKTYATRIDDTKPTLVPSTLTVTCYPTLGDAQAAIYTATMISDNCSDIEDIDILYSNTGACPTTSITMTATDECGNSRSITYNGLCIGSGSSVMITTPATPGTATCTNEVTALAAWLANHGGAVATGSGVIWTYPPVVFGAINCMTHSKVATVVFTATDGCGYTAQTTSTFTVSDNTPPTANMIANTNLSCTNVIPVPDVNLVTGEADNCGGTPTVTVGSTTDNLASGCPASPRVITHQYIVTDSYCNTAAVNHLIMIVDNVKPTFTAPINATISVNASCVYIASTATTGDVTNEADNCTSSGPGLQAIYTDVVAAGPMGANPKFIITRTWTLVDACGNTAIPRTQTITVNDNTVPTITGCPSNLTLPGGTIEGQCGSYFGAQAAPSIADNCSGATLSYALSGVSPGMGAGNVPNGTIFNEGVTTVTYTVRDAVGNTATCSFTVTVNCTTVEGRIVWEHNGAGVNTATVSLAPTAPLVTDLTDAAGDYSLAAPGPGNFTITPVKNNGGAAGRLNGVDAADVLAIQNHVNGMAVIMNPYKKVCADVNRSNVITNQDATTITQAIAGVPAALLAFNVFWRFVPKPPAFVWPPAGNNVIPPFPENIAVLVAGADILGQDFIGMKIGDVNGTANPATAPMAPLVWVLQDQTLVAGTEIELDFATANFNNLAAYQFGLDFDPTQLQFVNFQSLGALPMNMVDNFGAYHADLGELRTIWTASNSMGRTLTDGTSVFRAKFKVLASGQKLSQVLRLDDSQIECKAYSQALAPTEVKIVFAESVGTDTPLDLGNAQLQLMQNRPNPFSDATTIGFILPEACDAHIRILDISGRELTTYDRTYTAGYHELDFRMENAWSYGVLFCELVTPQGKRMIKMITSK